MGLTPTKNIKLIVSLLCAQLVCCEAFESLSQYARIRQMYPKVADNEAVNWRMSPGEDTRAQPHPCKRECGTTAALTCYYYMVIHYDETIGPMCNAYLEPQRRFKMADEEYLDVTDLLRFNSSITDCKYADGVKTQLMVVNGQFPGQAVEVCQGDTIVADVINSMRETTTLHWHGMHQRKAPHMDGVPHVTQYPIEPGQAYRYSFEVDHVGTNWWHSHTNNQRAFGIAGPLVVRQPRAGNPHAQHYDFDLSEHIIFMQDWMYSPESADPQNILINGLGKNLNNEAKKQGFPTLYADFRVVRGGRYRFRAIFNGIASCPITLSIDNHDLVVIANDGNDIEPVTVRKITFNAGERFDFVLHANQEVNNYWVRVKGLNMCSNNKLHQQAILRYNGAAFQAQPQGDISYEYEPPGLELNPIDKMPDDQGKHITLVQLNALNSPYPMEVPPYQTHYTSMKVNTKTAYLFQMDDITFTMPQVSLLQSRNLGIGSYFCNKTQLAAMGRDCRNGECKCSNVIQVPAFKELEFVIYSASGSAHPIHLHGYTFRVVGMGFLGEQRIADIQKIDRETPLPRRDRNAPLKDTVQVPGFGYIIVRIYTDSPGYWLFHCHISPHAENGMVAVLRVGQDTEMKMCPVSNCGLCSSVL